MDMTQPESGVLIAGTIEPTINSSDRGKNAKECGEEIEILNGQSNHNIELISQSAYRQNDIWVIATVWNVVCNPCDMLTLDEIKI